MISMYVYPDPQGDTYVIIRGPLRDWLIRRRQPAMYSPLIRGWWLRKDRLDEVLALAELDHLNVRVRGDVT